MSAVPSTDRTPARILVRRAIGRERNPLCRRLDRSRSRLQLTVPAAIVACTVLAVLVALAVLHAGQAHDRQVQAHHHRVTATTTTAAEAAADPAQNGQYQALAVWTYPPTGQRSGPVTVPGGTHSAATVPILVDDRGNAVAPPDATGPVTDALLLGSATLLVSWLTTEVGFTLRRRALDRRAARAWATEWEQVEPGWSGRHRPRPGTGQL
jgi:hypothetical protein